MKISKSLELKETNLKKNYISNHEAKIVIIKRV